MLLSFKTSLVYKAEIIFSILGSIILLTVWIFLWKYLYSIKGGIIGISEQYLVTYFILSNGLSVIMFNSDVIGEVVNDIRTGNIAFHLARPYNYAFSILAKTIGRKILFNSIFVVLPMVIIATVIFGFEAPASISRLFLAASSALIAFFIFFGIYFIGGLSAFWMMELHGAIPLLLENSIRLLSGFLIPIWLFPSWLYSIAQYLPIRCGFDLPLSIYVGRGDMNFIINGFIIEFIWLILIYLIGLVVWNRGIQKLVIQGG